MTVYNINLGIGWASSGVEYAQAYRAQLLRRKGIKTKFIFTDFFGQDNISDMTRISGSRMRKSSGSIPSLQTKR